MTHEIIAGAISAEMFWHKVEQTDYCWNWLGRLDNGYGIFWAQGKNLRAHRIAWTLARGPIPEGLMPDHLCRNRACVNPEHMELVDNRTNVLRGVGVTALNATKGACPQGHPYDEENTQVTPQGWRSCRQCARRRKREQRARLALLTTPAEKDGADNG